MKGIELLIFDLDGTLVEFKEEGMINLIKKSFNKFNKEVSNEECKHFWFSHKRDDLVKSKGLNLDDFWGEFAKNDTMRNRSYYARPYVDTEALNHLNEIKMAIVTSAHPNIAYYELSLLYKFDFNTMIVGHPLLKINPKPDPDGINRCLEELKVNRENAMMVGDTNADVLAGINAGIKTCFVDREHEKLENKANYIIKNLYQLLDIE